MSEIELCRPDLRNIETNYLHPQLNLTKRERKFVILSVALRSSCSWTAFGKTREQYDPRCICTGQTGWISTIIQCCHILADSRKRSARAQNRRDCENPNPLDVGETIIVTKLALLDHQLPYLKGIIDPAKFGNQNKTLAPQTVALNYAAANEFDKEEITGEIQPILSGGLYAKTEPYVVIYARDHFV